MVLARRLIALSAATALVMLLLTVLASAAGANQTLEFDETAALAANGPIPPIPSNPLEEVKEVCGSETAVFGSELFNTPPSEIKVKDEWADVVPGKDMLISGTITNIEFSGGDLSIDHPWSTDYTFDVLLDEAYWPLSRELGPGSSEGAGEHELHMELEVGQLLHELPQKEGPASGEPWELLPFEQTEVPTPTLNTQAHQNLQAAWLPQVGERVAMRGRWIIDCGHDDFHTELHPITMLAFAHTQGKKTITHVIANAYRVTERYGSGTGGVNEAPKGLPFPQGLEAAIQTGVEAAIGGAKVPVSLPVSIERTQPSTVPMIICPPEGGPAKPKITKAIVVREGARLTVKRFGETTCATARGRVGRPTEGKFGHYTAKQPPSRSCVLPWTLASLEVAGGLGIGGVKNNEVERIIVNAAGGTFTIIHAEETTAALPYNATATEVREALEGLASIGAGNVFVSGGPGSEGGSTPYTVAFVGELAEKAITPITTDRSGLVAGGKTGLALATVVVLVPGGTLDLHRFILALVEQKVKAQIEGFEEHGVFVGAIKRIEENIAKNPNVACLDPLSAPLPSPGPIVTNNEQPFPYYGEITVE
jgi:hypothetical protein